MMRYFYYLLQQRNISFILNVNLFLFENDMKKIWYYMIFNRDYLELSIVIYL
jgi:hypothetical protein